MGRALPVAIHNIKTHFSRPLRISPCGSRQRFLLILLLRCRLLLMQEKILFQNIINYYLRQDVSMEYLQLHQLYVFHSTRLNQADDTIHNCWVGGYTFVKK